MIDSFFLFFFFWLSGIRGVGIEVEKELIFHPQALFVVKFAVIYVCYIGTVLTFATNESPDQMWISVNLLQLCLANNLHPVPRRVRGQLQTMSKPWEATTASLGSSRIIPAFSFFSFFLLLRLFSVEAV